MIGIKKPTKATRPSLLKKKDKGKQWEVVREKVIQAAKVGDVYQCHHCKKLFPKEEVCADHWPFSRGSRPDLFLDIQNLVCCCLFCNVSDSPHRQ